MTDLAVEPRHAAAYGGGGWRLIARGLGQLLITVGLLILLFVTYELWGTGFYTQAQQHKLENTIQKQWTASGPDISTVSVDKVPLGSGVAVLFIPRFGRHYHFVVVEGTDFADLQRGPGHYPGTALPGQVGTVVQDEGHTEVAAHQGGQAGPREQGAGLEELVPQLHDVHTAGDARLEELAQVAAVGRAQVQARGRQAPVHVSRRRRPEPARACRPRPAR